MPIVIATLLAFPPENSEIIEDVEEVRAAVETIVICIYRVKEQMPPKEHEK
jgi:hypothetical protein